MTLTPNNPFSSPRGMPLPAGVDRRQAPRIQPVSPNAYNTAGAMGARTSTLEELKLKSRKAGEASFFYFDHHFQYNAVKVLPGEYFVAVTRDADESDLTDADLLERLSRQAQLIRLADGERRSLPLTAPDPRRRLAGRD